MTETKETKDAKDTKDTKAARDAIETKNAKQANEAKESDKSLNASIAELDAEVAWFYSDDFKLEEAVERYQKAAKLAKQIESELQTLKNEIEVLAEDFSK